MFYNHNNNKYGKIIMRSKDRENKLYSEGKRVRISLEEEIISNMIVSNEKKNTKLLDIGCGSGEIAKHYSDLSYNVVGVDFSDVAIDLSKKLGIDAYEMNLDSGLSFEDNEFDFVLAGDVMEHVFDPIFVFSEIGRVLKENGSFYATIPHDLYWKNRILPLLGKSFQENVYKKYGQFKHHTFFSEKLLRFMLSKAGLRIQSIKYLFKNPLKKNKVYSHYKIFRIFSTLMIIQAIKS